MKKIETPDNIEIGFFDGSKVVDRNGVEIYRMSDDDVFCPPQYESEGLSTAGGKPWIWIGQLINGQCIGKDEKNNDVVIFRVIY